MLYFCNFSVVTTSPYFSLCTGEGLFQLPGRRSCTIPDDLLYYYTKGDKERKRERAHTLNNKQRRINIPAVIRRDSRCCCILLQGLPAPPHLSEYKIQVNIKYRLKFSEVWGGQSCDETPQCSQSAALTTWCLDFYFISYRFPLINVMWLIGPGWFQHHVLSIWILCSLHFPSWKGTDYPIHESPVPQKVVVCS